MVCCTSYLPQQSTILSVILVKCSGAKCLMTKPNLKAVEVTGMVSEDSRGLRRVAVTPLVQLWGVPGVGTADQLLQSDFLVSLQSKFELNNVPILVFVFFFFPPYVSKLWFESNGKPNLIILLPKQL